MDIVIDYTPNKKQALFHSSPATECVYGGAKGGGKSCGLVMDALYYGLKYPGANIYLFRETYAMLEDTLIPEWIEKVPKELYEFKGKNVQAELINGSTIRFRYVRNYTDATKYQGYSMDYIGIDEMTKHEERTIQELLSCMRSAKGFPVRFRGTCNPGGKF